MVVDTVTIARILTVLNAQVETHPHANYADQGISLTMISQGVILYVYRNALDAHLQVSACRAWWVMYCIMDYALCAIQLLLVKVVSSDLCRHA